LRYRLESFPHNPVERRFLVRVLPEMMVGTAKFAGVKGLPPVSDRIPDASVTFTVHWFPSEAHAREWREQQIIRETITAGMRAKP
jgi:hypothetical protein